MNRSVVFYLPEGFADWEGAFLMPELREAKRSMLIVSETGESVSSIGGLKVSVEASLAKVSPENCEALVLIGSDGWADVSQNKKVLELAKDFHQRGILVAGICAATMALARTGLLDQKKHTSNNLAVLKKMVPSYQGEKNYQNKLTVTDGNLITASGVGAVDFTADIMKYIKLYPEQKIQQWYALFKHGTPPPPEFWG